MDARIIKLFLFLATLASLGAGYRTPNFIVEAPTAELAKEIGDAAEKLRRELAIEWLGEAFPNWSQPCPIVAKVSESLGAGGKTSFVFDRGHVSGWDMEVQGSRMRILDSVLPHEITHTIFATHFRQPLPRWADEGACTTVEHPSERAAQQQRLIQFLQTGRGIAFSKMFAMRDYPNDIMPLYAQGYSLAKFLIGQGGKRKYVRYIGDGLNSGNWPEVTRKHYGYQDLAVLQDAWLNWVKQGSPDLPNSQAPVQIASNQSAPDTNTLAANNAANTFATNPAGSASAPNQTAVDDSIYRRGLLVSNTTETGADANSLAANTSDNVLLSGRSIYAQGSRGTAYSGADVMGAQGKLPAPSSPAGSEPASINASNWESVKEWRR